MRYRSCSLPVREAHGFVLRSPPHQVLYRPLGRQLQITTGQTPPRVRDAELLLTLYHWRCVVESAIAQVLHYRQRAAITVAQLRPRLPYQPYFLCPQSTGSTVTALTQPGEVMGPSRNPMRSASLRRGFELLHQGQCKRSGTPHTGSFNLDHTR